MGDPGETDSQLASILCSFRDNSSGIVDQVEDSNLSVEKGVSSRASSETTHPEIVPRHGYSDEISNNTTLEDSRNMMKMLQNMFSEHAVRTEQLLSAYAARTEQMLSAQAEPLRTEMQGMLGELRTEISEDIGLLQHQQTVLDKHRDRLESSIGSCNKRIQGVEHQVESVVRSVVAAQEDLVNLDRRFGAMGQDTESRVKEQVLDLIVPQLSELSSKVGGQTKIIDNLQSSLRSDGKGVVARGERGTLKLANTYSDRDIPKFSAGIGQHPRRHVSKLEEFFQLYDCSEEEKGVVARRCVPGVCMHWLTLCESRIKTYQDFRSEFMKEYWNGRIQGIDRAELYQQTCEQGGLEAHLAKVVERSQFYDIPMREEDVVTMVYLQLPIAVQELLAGKEATSIEQLRGVLKEIDRINSLRATNQISRNPQAADVRNRPPNRESHYDTRQQNYNYQRNDGRGWRTEQRNRNDGNQGSNGNDGRKGDERTYSQKVQNEPAQESGSQRPGNA